MDMREYGKVVPGIITHHAMNMYVKWKQSSTILDLSTRWTV
jgi:hypothetical protein